MAEPTRAIYVRVPANLADKLDRVAERLGMSKRDVITRLVGDRLTVEDDLRPQRFWVDPALAGNSEPDVLTPEQAADLLQVEVSDITEMAEAGELPARRIGGHWRLSRTALLDWLRHH
ncbi:MAG TPA: helix-turn-helix domain-containing protein [Mycobacteriales bacterium]|nr:helix-turn-helix domain-containing protein [Mycobacteriales bacterium]